MFSPRQDETNWLFRIEHFGSESGRFRFVSFLVPALGDLSLGPWRKVCGELMGFEKAGSYCLPDEGLTVWTRWRPLTIVLRLVRLWLR